MSTKEVVSRFFLVGFPAVGKTDVGEILARKFGTRFVDICGKIEDSCGVRSGIVFEIEGEAGYHARAMQFLSDSRNLREATFVGVPFPVAYPTQLQRVVSPGVWHPESRARTIYLRVDPARHLKSPKYIRAMQQAAASNLRDLLQNADEKLVQLADLAVRVDDGLSIAARRVAEWIHAGSPKNQILSTASADYIALSLVDGRLRLVTFGQDQRYQFLDNGQNLHNLVLLHASKQKTLASAIAELEALINDRRVTESALQRFFEMYPEVLLDEGYSRAHPHVVLSRQDGGVLVPDFVLEPTSQGRFCDLLELKLPRERIYAGTAARLRWSRAVMAARSQLREYSRYFDETPNRHYVLKTYGLNAYRPKLFVVIGRSASETSVVQRDLEVETPGLILKTYDDLLERAKHRLSLNGNAR